MTGGCGTGPRPDAGTGVGRRPRSFVERGSGTVLAVGVVSVLATLLLAGALVASVAVTGQRARTAADLAALAAVGEALTGAPQDRACKVAEEVALGNGAEVGQCLSTLDEAGRPRVEVVVVSATPGGRWTVTRRAAAGAVPDGSAVQVEPAPVLGGGGP